MYYRWCIHTKSLRACIMQVFLPWQRSSVADVLHHARRCYLQSRKMFFAASKPFFLAFFPSSPQFLPLSQPSPPPLALPSQSIPHFWSIFYALLHYSQLPFTVHYLLPSFTNTLYTSLSFLQSLCIPPSLLPSLALLQCVITLSSTSLLRSPFFIISLSFLRSRHLMLISRVSFPPYHYFPSSLSFCIHPCCLFALMSSFLSNWLFKACHVLWYLTLPQLFYNSNLQMSANVINSAGGTSV